MLRHLEKIKKLLAEDNIGEAVKLMKLVEPHDKILNLNYYRSILAVKRNDFRSANLALDSELKWFPENDQARVLKTLISEPLCRPSTTARERLNGSEDKKKYRAGIEQHSPEMTSAALNHGDSIIVDKKKSQLKYLNLGCGSRFHAAWTNVDFKALSRNVMQYDLLQGIPFPDGVFDAVYHSHLLEHLPKDHADEFLKECFRVIKPGGILRVVVPDLEAIAALYVSLLNEAARGDKVAQERYDWIMLEMLDQMVRNVSGGEMQRYLEQTRIPAEDFVRERCGKGAVGRRRISKALSGRRNRGQAMQNKAKKPTGALEIGSFRLSGEAHQWMYDRYSLAKLLREAGFEEITLVSADESRIPKFNSYLLDIDEDNLVRKPDSLFMEAIKPFNGAKRVNVNLQGPEVTHYVRKLPLRSVNVAHLCMQDFGGAGNAAYRLHRGLQKIGVNSTMVVLNKRSGDSSVRVVPDGYTGESVRCMGAPGYMSPVWNRQNARWQSQLSQYQERPRGLEIFTDAMSDVRLDCIQEIQEADIINLHWVAGMVNWPNAKTAFGDKPIVWTLHDMNAFTGGCHYAEDCDKYREGCGACPQLGSNNEDDLSYQEWMKKRRAFESLNIVSVVTPSRWLGKCVGQSRLLGKVPVSVIPNGCPLDTFEPYPRIEGRRKLGLPESKKIVLFGADSVLNRRKGFAYLIESLNQLSLKDGSDVILLTFGNLPKGVNIPSKYSVVNLGMISDEKQLAMAYSVADVFVLPSLEDNLPNTVIEAMACGVPVVGFDIGGMSDMVKHKSTGYLAKARDIKGLSDGMDWTLSSADRGRDFRKACREKVEREYGLEIQANAYRELYAEMKTGPSMHTSEIGDRKTKGEDRRGELQGHGGRILQEKLYQSAHDAVAQGNPIQGIKILEELVKAYPEVAPAYHDLGALHFDQGNRDKALACYKKAAELGPNSPIFQKDLADFYYAVLGRVEDALEHYAWALSANPKDVHTLLMLGHISVSKKRLDSAEEFYTKVLEIDPWNTDTRNKLEAIKEARNSNGRIQE
ncbi:MAG: glycosyltransferase [Deltaproteobacteria bacterium]|nr:glycosyltransferase [Deltaproteobacteria bacterium]